MILGGKYGKRRSIRSKDHFFFRERHDFGRKIRKKEIKRRSIQSEDLFLEIIIIFGQKLQVRDQNPLLFLENTSF